MRSPSRRPIFANSEPGATCANATPVGPSVSRESLVKVAKSASASFRSLLSSTTVPGVGAATGIGAGGGVFATAGGGVLGAALVAGAAGVFGAPGVFGAAGVFGAGF